MTTGLPKLDFSPPGRGVSGMDNEVTSLPKKDSAQELALLDEVLEMIASRKTGPAIERLGSGLHLLRGKLTQSEWALFREACMRHPIAPIIHQDPLSSWSYRKPRGYPGDARLLDFIYGADNVTNDLASASELGRDLYRHTSQAMAPAAVRERRHILANLVDQVADERSQRISVLSIASGHLREAETSHALTQHRVMRWLALDQDQESLAHIRDVYPDSPIKPFHGSVRGLLTNHYELGTFDIVYTAGLYDYLSTRAAARLTEVTFKMLKPGGKLLLTNFARDIPDDGYMETFMDWHLLFRNEAEMVDICSTLPTGKIASQKLFSGKNGNVIYVLIEKN
jgi:SAM-dependent methyltransferase